MNIKRSMVAGAAVVTLATGLGGVGLASAATDNTSTKTSGETSIVDKLASKFNLKKADVQAVFDADRTEHDAKREADQKDKLATAVKDGKLTQAQADHITQALSEIKSLRGTTEPKDESSTVRDQVKAKMDELRTWATTNKVDMQYVMPGPGGHHGGPMGADGVKPAAPTADGTTDPSTN